MYFKTLFCICFLYSYMYASNDANNHKDSNKDNNIKFSIQNMESIHESMQEVYEREAKNTIKPTQDSIENLQIGVSNVTSIKDKKIVKQRIKNNEYKTQLFAGVQIGSTFTAVSNSVNVLPTINLKIGFQNFLGIAKKQVGLKIYFDSFIASNVLSSLKNNPFTDFIDSSFNAVNLNAEVMYEFPISKYFRFGFSGGYGIGYMTYEDKYWDKLNGFASNISLSTYFSFKEVHKFELVLKSFFYHYGSYVTRKLDNVVQNPHSIYSADFTQPINLSIGWIYVF